MRAAALLVLAMAALAAGCSGSPAGPTTAAEPGATLEVRQVQTALGSAEGSIGVLMVGTPDDSRVGPLLLAGREAREVDPATYESAFRPIALPPGEYEIALWQHPCSGVCESDEEIIEANDPPGEQLDLCTIRVTLTPGETRTLTATWAPGQGCTSFA